MSWPCRRGPALRRSAASGTGQGVAAEGFSKAVVDERWRRIVKGASKVIAAKGFAKATIREIAAASDMPVATMYQYLERKEDILHNVYRFFMTEIVTALTRWRDSALPPKERLSGAIRTVVEVFDRNHRFIKLMFQESRALTPEGRRQVYELDAQYIAIFQELLTGVHAQRRLRDPQPGACSELHLFPLHHLAAAPLVHRQVRRGGRDPGNRRLRAERPRRQCARRKQEHAMKFMFFSEAETLPGASYQTRYWELVEQVIHAEKWGFDVFGVSEQQYAIGGIATSCPEVLFGYLFPLTKTLRFAHAITLMPRRMNHALRIASRTAVQDILSNGRIELGVGRGNTTLALRAFEVDLEKNRDEVNEGIQILKKAFTEDPFMFYGEHYKIPPRSLVPKPLQSPHPPIAVAATSAESHRMAGNLGVGVYSWSNFMGWDALAESISAFRTAIGETRARGEHVNDSAGALLQAYCAETDAIAEAEAGAGNLKWLRIAIDGYPRLAKVAQSYSYYEQDRRGRQEDG